MSDLLPGFEEAVNSYPYGETIPVAKEVWEYFYKAGLKTRVEKGIELEEAEFHIGRWLSAALDDPKVCAQMKHDITRWMVAINSKDH